MKRALLASLSVLAGAGGFALVLVVSDSSLADVAEGLQRAGWAALGTLFGVVVLGLAFQAASWRFLLPPQERVGFAAAFGSVLVGWAFNFLTPSAYLGGEPVRMLYVARRSRLDRRRILATIIVHKYLELTTFLVFLGASTAILLVTYGHRLEPSLRIVVVATVGFLFALGAVLYLSFVRRWGLIVRICDAAAALGVARRWLRANRRKVLEVESHVHRAFTHHLGRTLVSLAWLAPFTLLLFLRPVAVFGFVEGDWPFHVAELATVFCLIQLLQALQFTPGGLGLLEGGIPAILLLVGVPAPAGLAFMAFTRATDIAVVGGGCALLVHEGVLEARRLEPRCTMSKR